MHRINTDINYAHTHQCYISFTSFIHFYHPSIALQHPQQQQAPHPPPPHHRHQPAD